jgi:hypothetical protein
MQHHCVLLSLTFCRSLMVGWSRGRLQFKKGRMMRTSPCWIQLRFGLLRVTSRHQLGLHIWDLVLFTISLYAPTLSINIVAPTSSSPAYDYFLNKYDYFNNSYDSFRLLQQLVRLLLTTLTTRTTTYEYFNNSYFLCDHDKVLRHLFRAMSAFYRVGP